MQVATVSNFETKKSSLNIKESLASLVANSALAVAPAVVSVPVINKISNIGKKLSKDEVVAMNNAAQKILENTGLKKLGVEIVDMSNIFNMTGMPVKLAEILNPIIGASRGKNAFFTPKNIFGVIDANKIGINTEKLPNALFHEIGHALNYNKGKIFKVMQKLRTPGMILASLLAIFPALTKNTKAKEGQELSKAQKIKNGVRDKAGLLAFGAMVPMLLEEAVASVKGCKLAKGVLSKDLFKKVAKTNAVAYVSYLATAVGIGIAAWGTRKVKDKLVERKEAKLQQAQK
ncbi:MAG: hypothetical protein E7Z91_03065 [Cyanobacteria bacterium SIG30]|nr:hypothetical protein [Cyanobacteria bacterium SIG30]